MTNMKTYRFFASLICLTLILAACGSPAPTPKPAEPPTPVPAKPFRVAVIMPSAVNDIAFSQSMFAALNRVQADMGGSEKMQYVYSQGMGVIDDATAALQVYASKGYDLVIAHGSQYG